MLLLKSSIQSDRQLINRITDDLQSVLLPNCLNPSSATLRHGSISAVSEYLLSIAKLGYEIQSEPNGVVSTNKIIVTAEVVHKIIAIVPELNRLRLYRGKGSEYLRVASCELISSISNSAIPSKYFASNPTLSKKLMTGLLDALNENIKQPHESIQIAAQKAIRLFLFTYFRTPYHEAAVKEPIQAMKQVLRLYIDGLRKDLNVAVTRGYALALGALPVPLLLSKRVTTTSESIGNASYDSFASTLQSSYLLEIMFALKDMANINKKIAGEPDPETRRNCLIALTEITEKISPYLPVDAMAPIHHLTWSILKEGTNDYSSDKRGDTGSWSRIEALSGLERLCSQRRWIYGQINQTISALEEESSMREHAAVYTAYGLGRIHSINHSDNAAVIRFPSPSLISRMNDGLTVDIGDKSSPSTGINPCHAFFLTASLDICKSQPRNASQSVLMIPSYDTRGIDMSKGIKQINFEEELFQLCLKQLSEKLDSVRECAGNILERLLISHSSFASSESPWNLIPKRDVLIVCWLAARQRVAGITNDEAPNSSSTSKPVDDEDKEDDIALEGISDSKPVDTSNKCLQWGKCSHVFPFLRDLSSQMPFETIPWIIPGLIMSIGGLSESIAKEALQALLQFHSMLRIGEQRDRLRQPNQGNDVHSITENPYNQLRDGIAIHRYLLNHIASLLSFYVSDQQGLDYDRSTGIVASIIKTVDLLLHHSIVDPSISAHDYVNLVQIQQIIMKIVVTTTSIPKIRSCVEVFNHLIQNMSHGILRCNSLIALINLLGHKYPKIRSCKLVSLSS